MTISAILQFYFERKKERQREKRKPLSLTSQLLYPMILQEFRIII